MSTVREQLEAHALLCRRLYDVAPAAQVTP